MTFVARTREEFFEYACGPDYASRVTALSDQELAEQYGRAFRRCPRKGDLPMKPLMGEMMRYHRRGALEMFSPRAAIQWQEAAE